MKKRPVTPDIAPPKTGIVEATMVGSAALSPMRPGAKRLSKLIEAAMSQAVLDATEQGITDPVKIKALMMAYREQAKKELAEAPVPG